MTGEIIVAASTLQIDLAPSIAATMLDGLAYLTGYPYGCVEQTMSKALPNAVVGRALTTLNVSQPQLTNSLTKPINAGLQRLYGYQHSDGGWGWWYDDETDDYQTAYVLFGLSMTKQAGYLVDEAVIDPVWLICKSGYRRSMTCAPKSTRSTRWRSAATVS